MSGFDALFMVVLCARSFVKGTNFVGSSSQLNLMHLGCFRKEIVIITSFYFAFFAWFYLLFYFLSHLFYAELFSHFFIKFELLFWNVLYFDFGIFCALLHQFRSLFATILQSCSKEIFSLSYTDILHVGNNEMDNLVWTSTEKCWIP